MSERRYTVLFLCTGNSARSDHGGNAAELLGDVAVSRLSAPAVIRRARCIPSRSKPATQPPFGGRAAQQELGRVRDTRLLPRSNFVFTVCDRAAAEVCPIWPGQPMTAHWGIPRSRRGRRHVR